MAFSCFATRSPVITTPLYRISEHVFQHFCIPRTPQLANLASLYAESAFPYLIALKYHVIAWCICCP